MVGVFVVVPGVVVNCDVVVSVVDVEIVGDVVLQIHLSIST